MIKKRVTLVALSFLFAHDPDNKKIVIDDFIRIGLVSNAIIKQNGLGSFYRLKRVTNNTFRDLKMYAHFFDSRSELKMRVKSSNKYDFNSNPKSILGKIFFSLVEEISKLLIIVTFWNPIFLIEE